MILIQYSIMSHSQFNWLNPLPQGNTLNSVYFVNENMGYVVGNYGTALTTIDGGLNWTILNTNTTKNLNAVYFITDNYGFAVGDSGTIIMTIDQGVNWTAIPSGINNNLYSVLFTDSLYGYSCGHNGVIIKTINGGNQWDTCTSNINTKLYSINFPSKEIGYIAGGGGTAGGYGHILKTIDEGENWTLLTDSLEESFYSIDFIDTLTGYAAGNFSYIVKTEDGGKSWISIDNPNNYNNYHIRSIKFINSQIGFTCDVFGNIMKTGDGSQSWTNLNSNTGNTLFSINKINNNSICVVGGGGIILISTDYGTNFTNSQNGFTNSLFTINKTDNNHIFIIGDEILIKTSDGGTNWQSHAILELDGCESSHFINSLTGYAITYSGDIYKTINSGITWTNINKKKMSWFGNIYMVNESLGFVVGGGQSPGGATWGTLWKTTDGNNWISQTCPSSTALNKTYFKDNETGYLIGSYGKLYSTDDAGNNWSLIPLSISHGLIDMIFLDYNIGYILGYDYWQGNIILKTNNTGLDWKVVYEDDHTHYNNAFRSFHFIDTLTGYVIGTDGYIVYTNDGGQSWMTKNSFTNNYLNSILLLNDSSGFIIGNYGTFASFGNIESAMNVPEYQFDIFSNLNTYPNPFSESFQFELYSNIKDEITMALIDMNGRLVYKKNIAIIEGNQIVNINPGANLINGIYIYKIKGSKIFNTGKIIRRMN